jgi:hypothetical protein
MRDRVNGSNGLQRMDRLASIVFTIVVAFGPATARADTETCLSAYDANQRLRRDGKLRDAREQLLICSQADCPAPVRNECTKWLSEVDATLPSVVFAAQDAFGTDLAAVTVEVDGVVLTRKLDGRAIAVDPGEHVIRWTSEDGVTVQQRVIVREAEKRRLVVAKFPAPPEDGRTELSAPLRRDLAAPAIHPAGSQRGPEPARERAPLDRKRSAIPTESWVLGGIGAAGLASFGFFGWRAWWETDDLRERCAPSCSSSDVDAAKTKALVADISLGVAVLGFGGATYFVLRQRSEEAASVDVGVGPGWLGMRGAF